MSAWRREAIARMPMFRQEIQETNNIADLCHFLAQEVWLIYGRADIIGSRITHSPADEECLHSIYDYAGWCLLHSHNPGIVSDLVLWFFESLSTATNAYVAQEFDKYLPPEVFEALHQYGILAYIVGESNVEAFAANYRAHRAQKSKNRTRAAQQRAAPNRARPPRTSVRG